MGRFASFVSFSLKDETLPLGNKKMMPSDFFPSLLSEKSVKLSCSDVSKKVRTASLSFIDGKHGFVQSS